jgi:hypothetical protein
MRTTIDVPNPKYRLLKSMAASQGTTVKELVLRGVDVVLAIEDPPRQRRLKLPLIDSDNPGSLLIDNGKIYDLIGFP